MTETLLQTSTSPNWSVVSLRRIIDERGSLAVIEGGQDIDFEIRRTYHLYDVPSGSERAGHAHKRLHQLYLAPSGSFDVHLEDGVTSQTITMNRPNLGLRIRPRVWRTIDNFSSGSVCFVLASELFLEADYVRTHDEFVRRSTADDWS